MPPRDPAAPPQDRMVIWATVREAGQEEAVWRCCSTMMLHSSSWRVSGRDSEVFRDLKKLSDFCQRMIPELFFRAVLRPQRAPEPGLVAAVRLPAMD